MMFRGIAASLLGLLVIACSACGGGGGGSSPAAETTAAPATAKKVVTIDAEGDSTYYGTQVINGETLRTEANPPALLQQKFGTSVIVINSAKGGADVTQALFGIAPRYADTMTTRIASDGAQLVLSNFAINDSIRLSQEDYRNGLISWVNAVRNMGRTPVLEEPNPTCAPNVMRLDEYVTILRDVASQQSVTLITQYDYIKSLPNWQGMLSDCIHPLDPLYAIKAQREYDVLAPIVATLAK
jgi:hypothetical protein